MQDPVVERQRHSNMFQCKLYMQPTMQPYESKSSPLLSNDKVHYQPLPTGVYQPQSCEHIQFECPGSHYTLNPLCTDALSTS